MSPTRERIEWQGECVREDSHEMHMEAAMQCVCRLSHLGADECGLRVALVVRARER